jgi:uncharacterized membrane protein YesL
MMKMPKIKPIPRFAIGLAGALIGICDVYLIFLDAMYACPLDYNLQMALFFTFMTLGVPVVFAAAMGAAAALRSPQRVRLGLAAASLLLIGAFPFVNALPHAVPSVESRVCQELDF